jgi:hypothetical protein
MEASELMRRGLAEAVGRGVLDDGLVKLVGGIQARCHVAQINRHGGVAVVELQLALSGGPFGDRWVLERWGGVGAGTDDAIVQGVSDWCRVPHRALERALDGSEPTIRAELHGAPLRAYADDVMMRGAEVAELVGRLRQGSPCAEVLAHPELLPILGPGRAHLLTCFAARPGDGAPVIEVTIDGAPWPPAARAFDALRWPDHVAYASLRQTAVVFADAPALSHRAVEATFRGLSARDVERQAFGAAVHDYALAPPLDEGALASLADLRLPDDYARYLREVSAGGAGPYLGLLSPHAPSQRATARGRFPHEAAWQPDAADEDDDALVAGTLALSHLGCGYFSFLVLDGPARGQVWADLRYAGQGLVPTHASFEAWYLDAIDAAVRGQLPSLPVERSRCALPNALSRFAEQLEQKEPGRDLRQALAELSTGAIRTTAGGSSSRFAAGDSLSLCPSCTDLIDRLGVPHHAVAPGVPPKAWREAGWTS